MKVKLKKAPKTGDQLPDGTLYTNQSLLSVQKPEVEDTRSTEQQVPRDFANVEAEKGEYKIKGDLTAFTKISGKTHAKGGTPIQADPGDFIVSNSVKVNPDIASALKLPEAKDNQTWADYAGKQVDPKYFNKLNVLMKQQEKGDYVDPYNFNTAKNKLPKYQTTLSKVALGNELSKAVEGKDFTIPQVAMPALQDIQAETTETTPEHKKFGGQVKMPNGGSYGQSLINQVKALGYNPKNFADAQNYYFNTAHPTLAGYYGQNIAPVTNKGKRLFPGKVNTDLTSDQARQQLTDGLWDYRTFGVGDRTFENKDDYNKFISSHNKVPTEDMDYYQDPEKSTSTNTVFTTARYKPDASIIPIDTEKVPGLTPSISASAKPASFIQTGKTLNKVAPNPQAPYSVMDQLAFASAAGNKPKTYYPWAQKTNPEYIDAITDTPDYNAILSSQRTQGDELNQISDASTARAVGSFQPGLIQGINQETQRSRQFNLQSKQQADFYNNQISNRSNAINAQIDTDLYNKNIMSREQSAIADKLWKDDMFSAANNGINNRNRMQMFQVQNPQFTVDEFGNYVFNQNGADKLNQTKGQSPVDMFKAQTRGMTPEQVTNFVAWMKAMKGGK